jgi:hypothetical protein
VLCTNSTAGRFYTVRADIYIANFHRFSTDSDPLLLRVTGPVPEMEDELWLLIHPDLHNKAHIKTCTDFMAAPVASNQDVIGCQALAHRGASWLAIIAGLTYSPSLARHL